MRKALGMLQSHLPFGHPMVFRIVFNLFSQPGEQSTRRSRQRSQAQSRRVTARSPRLRRARPLPRPHPLLHQLRRHQPLLLCLRRRRQERSHAWPLFFSCKGFGCLRTAFEETRVQSTTVHFLVFHCCCRLIEFSCVDCTLPLRQHRPTRCFSSRTCRTSARR